eukprot:8209239-Alexandrium_andersonii.AAC.1
MSVCRSDSRKSRCAQAHSRARCCWQVWRAGNSRVSVATKCQRSVGRSEPLDEQVRGGALAH